MAAQFWFSIFSPFMLRLFLFISFIFISFFSNAQDPKYGSSESAVSLLSEYIRIASPSGNERESGEFLKKQCINRGLHIQQFTDSAGQYNFAASLFPLQLNKPNIVFLNHIDVVPVENDEAWLYPPFSGTIADNKVWGRGALDCKGLAVIQLLAIDRIIQSSVGKDLPYNITLLCVSGEETGGITGSANVANNFLDLLHPAVIIGEGGSGMEDVAFLPSGRKYFGISIAEKSMLWVKLSCEINSHGHSSVPTRDYSNKRLVIALNRLLTTKRQIEFTAEAKLMFKVAGESIKGIKGFAMKNIGNHIFRPTVKNYIKKNPELEAILCNTITLASIRNPEAQPNQTPQIATAILDCRLLPGVAPESMIEYIRKTIDDTIIKVSIINRAAMALSTKPEYFYEELSKALKKEFSGAAVVPMLLPASTDNSYYRSKGCYAFGLNPFILSPLQIESIHKSNEYIDIEDIEQGINVFEQFLNAVNADSLRVKQQ